MLCQHSPLAARFIHSLPGNCAQTQLETEESQVVALARQGDAAAYGELVRRYQNRLCTALMHICGSFADAQDAAQEAFLRAFTKLHTFNGTSAFYTWLYRIAVNAAISQHRRRHLPSASERAEGAFKTEPTDRCELLDEQLMRRERAEEVRQALATLSDEHRAIIVLREIEDCDYDEIALILNVPVGTVRSRLHRARLQLRAKLRLVMEESSEYR
jgi:RNA polymerase sigma-70 factor (ECF subfamily)